VFALLLDDALLKHVATEVVLFSIVAFKTLTFHIATHLRCGVIFSDSIVTKFLLILTAKKTFENLSIFDEVIRHTKSATFLDHPVFVGTSLL